MKDIPAPFLSQVRSSEIVRRRQTLLFSATIPLSLSPEAFLRKLEAYALDGERASSASRAAKTSVMLVVRISKTSGARRKKKRHGCARNKRSHAAHGARACDQKKDTQAQSLQAII